MPLAAKSCAHIGVPDQGYVLNILQTHDPQSLSLVFVFPEFHAPFDFPAKLFFGHIGFMPSIRGNDPLIGVSRIVNNGEDHFEIVLQAFLNHTSPAIPGAFLASSRPPRRRIVRRLKGRHRTRAFGVKPRQRRWRKP